MIAPLTGDDVQSLRHCVEVALGRYRADVSELEVEGVMPGTRAAWLVGIFEGQIETAERLLGLLDDLGEESEIVYLRDNSTPILVRRDLVWYDSD